MHVVTFNAVVVGISLWLSLMLSGSLAGSLQIPVPGIKLWPFHRTIKLGLCIDGTSAKLVVFNVVAVRLHSFSFTTLLFGFKVHPGLPGLDGAAAACAGGPCWASGPPPCAGCSPGAVA